MQALPHWPAVRAAFDNDRVRCARTANWSSRADGPPYRCKGIYLGNSIFAPVLGLAKRCTDIRMID